MPIKQTAPGSKAAAAASTFRLAKGPDIGNVPTSDNFTRVKQNLDSLYETLGRWGPSLDSLAVNSGDLGPLKEQIDALQASAIQPATPGPPGPPGPAGGGANSYELAYEPLAGNNNTTVISTPVAAANAATGDFLTLFLKQPGNGGQSITFTAGPPGFRTVSANDLAPGNNMLTTMLFKKRADGDWWLLSMFSRRT